MARRRPVGGAVGGGGGIPAPRLSSPRAATGFAALAGTAGLVTYAALDEPVVGLLGAAGSALLVLALVLGRGGLVAPGLVLVLAEYAAVLAARDSAGLDPAAPLVGGGLLVVGELAYWSVDLASEAQKERSVAAQRLGVLVVLGLAAVGVGAGVLATTALPIAGGLVWNVVGVAAAVAAVGLIASLATLGASGHD